MTTPLSLRVEWERGVLRSSQPTSLPSVLRWFRVEKHSLSQTVPSPGSSPEADQGWEAQRRSPASFLALSPPRLCDPGQDTQPLRGPAPSPAPGIWWWWWRFSASDRLESFLQNMRPPFPSPPLSPFPRPSPQVSPLPSPPLLFPLPLSLPPSSPSPPLPSLLPSPPCRVTLQPSPSPPPHFPHTGPDSTSLDKLQTKNGTQASVCYYFIRGRDCTDNLASLQDILQTV